MTTIYHINESTASVPRNSGTNGDLVILLDFALVTTAGWAINQTASNARVYKPPSGNRFCLFVHHDSAVSGDARLAVVRGCESASSAAIAGLTNPFPTVAQVAAGSSNWLVSSLASTTARNFDIYVGPTWCIYLTNAQGTANIWEMGIFGDVGAALSADSWGTICTVRNSTNTSVSLGFSLTNTGVGASTRVYWCRSYDGTVNSSQGAFYPVSTGFGNASNLPTAQSGPSGLIDMVKCPMCDIGSATTTPSATKSIGLRGWFPNLWNPQHAGAGSVNTRDTWTNTAYSGSATFRAFSAAASPAAWVGIEETATWAVPGV